MITKIDGTYMDRSLNKFTEHAEVYIEAEQAKLTPDNALIALLCDAVRLTREMTLRDKRYAQRNASVAALLNELTDGRQ